LLWKVSGNGLSKPSYLFGTHHMIDKNQIKNFEAILALCSQTDVVVGELIMNDPTIQNKLSQGILMKGITMKELVTKEDYTFLDAEFKQWVGAGLDQLGNMKPMMLNTIFTMTYLLRMQNIAKQPEAVDAIFQSNAVANNKKVIGLETIEDQIRILFNGLSDKRQAEIMLKEIKDKKKGLQLFKVLNAAYVNGDLDMIQQIDNEDTGMTPEEKRGMLEVRNSNWLKQLPALMSSKSCFIAVGCMHLIGDTGLVLQLKKAGYSVEPVQL